MALAAHAATEIRSVDRQTPVEDILAIVESDGGVIIRNFVTAEQVAGVNGDIAEELAAMSAGSTTDVEEMAEFHGANTKRLCNIVTHSPTFRQEILDDDLVHDLLDAVFLEESGTYWMNSDMVIEIGPGSKAQPLHRDLENWFPFVDMGPKGPEAIVNFLIALTDFTEINGATRVIPRSNHWDDFHDRGNPELTVPAVMNMGDALFFSGKTAHGGGANKTAHEYRSAIAFSMTPGYLMVEEAYPLIIGREIAKSMPERVQRLMGFRSHFPTGSPGLWMVNDQELGDYLGLDD